MSKRVVHISDRLYEKFLKVPGLLFHHIYERCISADGGCTWYVADGVVKPISINRLTPKGYAREDYT